MGLGFEYAVLRPTWFMENFSEQQHLRTIKEEGRVYSAAGEGKIPWVSVEDIAEVGFRALVDQPSMDKDPVILGPELLSYDDVSCLRVCSELYSDWKIIKVAAILSEVLGREIKHVKLTQAELAERMQSLGMPADYANMLSSMDTMVAKGSEERLNDVVLKLTGKSPRKFRDFAEANKGCWT